MPDSQAVKIERLDSVCLLTLNRPEKLNAINANLSSLLGEALHSADVDPEIRVMVITGSGRAFSAGADLNAVGKGVPLVSEKNPEWGFAGITRQWIKKPLIAAVNGFAYGGGLEIVLACDIVVAEPDAKFALPEVTRGLIASAGGLLRLPHKIPERIAMEMALTGQPITAAQAAQWGLINRISETGQVLELALQIARVISENAPLAVEASKYLIQRGVSATDLWEQINWESNTQIQNKIFKTSDAQEGVSAFAERRKPDWKRS